MFVFDIKRYAINDGPGIRITIFMKGCPLSCVWCHNPEGISSRKQKLYTKKKCIGCRTCVEACPRAGIDTHAGGDRDGWGALYPVRNLCRGVSGFGDGDIGHGVFG